MNIRSAAARAWPIVCMLALVVASGAVQAQVPQIEKNLSFVKTTVVGVSVVLFTILTIAAGVEVGVRHRKLMDVWHLVVGAGITGSAAVIATAFLS